MTPYLQRNTMEPVIVLALNRAEYEFHMAMYGQDPDQDGIYPVYSLDDAYTISLGLGANTPWAKAGGSFDKSAALYLTVVYGPNRWLSEALNVQHVNDNVIDPKTLRG